MKQYGFILMYFLSTWYLTAQERLTAVILPEVGDSLAYAVDTLATAFVVGPAGEDLVWDFSNLKRTGRRSEVTRDPATGAGSSFFPTANLMMRTGIQERYMRKSSRGIEDLGTFTQSAGGPLGGFSGPNVYPKPIFTTRVPADFGNVLDASLESSIALSADFIPDSIRNSLPIKFDSFRIRTKQIIHKDFDAWGKMKLPSKEWNVLREWRTVTTSNSVDIKTFLGWQDVTLLAAGIFGPLLSSGTTNSYFFWSNSSKGFIANVSVDSAGNTRQIAYKPDAIQVGTEVVDAGSFAIFPTIFQDHLVIQSPLNKTTIHLYDIHGKLIYTSKIQNEAQPIELQNMATMAAGLYVIQLVDSDNGIQFTQEIKKL